MSPASNDRPPSPSREQNAARTSAPDSVVLFRKMADDVHGPRFRCAHIELLNAAAAVGFTACDCIVMVRKGPIMSPR